MLERTIGSIFAGYRIQRLIGRGGMGIIYLARHLALDRDVALKLVAPELAAEPAFQQRFARELRFMASIEHPNVIPVHEARSEDGQLFVAMRYVEGTDLRELITIEKRLEPARAVRIVAQVASALDAAHELGVVHRDVKPANVLIGCADEHVFLTDFGLSKHTDSNDALGLTAAGQWVGTVDYVAPEQILAEPLDRRADVYALGCMLYESLTGKVPYPVPGEAAKLWAHMHDPPPSLRDAGLALPALDAVVRKALAKSPADRYQTAGELAAAATTALGSKAPPAPPPRPPTQAPSRRPAPASAPRRSGAPAPVARTPSPAPARREAAAAAPARSAGAARDSRGRSAGAAPPRSVPAPAGSNGASAPPAAARPSRRGALIAGGLVALAAVAVAAVLLLRGGGGGGDGPQTSTIDVGRAPVAAAGDGNALWVANSGDETVTRIDAGSGQTVETVDVGTSPNYLTAGAGRVWVTDAATLRLRSIDPDDNRPREPIALTAIGEAMAFGDGSVWVLHSGRNSFSVVDGASGRVVGDRVKVGLTPVAIAAGEGAVWVASEADQRVDRIDPQTRDVVSNTRLNSSVSAVAAGGGSVWVANTDDDTVTRIDPDTGRVQGDPIPVGDAPQAIAVGEGAAWVANSGSDDVTRIDTRTGRVVGSPIDVGEEPQGIAVARGSIWVCNRGSDTVTRIQP